MAPPDPDRTASLMTPARLAQARKARAPASPAAWLDQMAADAGHAHVRRLRELVAALCAQLAEPHAGLLAADLSQLSASLKQLDFNLLRPRPWWLRAVAGRGQGSARFLAQFEETDEAVRPLAARLDTLRAQLAGTHSTAEKALVEVDLENRALEQIINQGARWLQDMRNQLNTAPRMAPGEPASGQMAQQAQQAQDAARCDILVARLQQLRAAHAAAASAREQAQALAVSRGALLQALQQTNGAQWQAWRSQLAALAQAALGSKRAAAAQPPPAQAQTRASVKLAATACAQLQKDQTARGAALAALLPALQAAD